MSDMQYQILENDDDILALLASLEPTAEIVDVGAGRIHQGKTFGADTIAIELTNGKFIVIG